jgi:hypothetical protein
VGDYTNPILKPEAAEVVRKYGQISLAGITYATPANQCWPQPVPYIFWTMGVQILQQPDKITILYSNPDHEFRQVRLNQSHPQQVTPSWYGDSVGHYEGDVLVVDTTGSKVSGHLPWSTFTALPTPRVCTWLNVIGWLITKPRWSARADQKGKYQHSQQ